MRRLVKRTVTLGGKAEEVMGRSRKKSRVNAQPSNDKSTSFSLSSTTISFSSLAC